MKMPAFLVAQVTALALLMMFSMDNSYGMGSKGNTDQLQQPKSGTGQPRNEHAGKGAGEDISKTGGTQNGNRAAVPEKKPRLKYRDEPGCPC